MCAEISHRGMSAAFNCTAATTNSLSLLWTALSDFPFGSLKEVQLGLEAEGVESPYISSITSAAGLVVQDLLPGTSYLLRWRSRSAGTREWSGLSAPVSCTTATLLPGQPRLLPPREPPTASSLFVAVDVEDGGVVVEARLKSGGDTWTPPIAVDADGKARIDNLRPSSSYEVRARSAAAAGAPDPPLSDVVIQQTATPGAANLTVYRISELCGASPPSGDNESYSYGGEYHKPCEPDNLYNHDSGSLLADIEFITAVAGGRPQTGFVPSFNGSVTSRYCVSRADRPFADYVSCNGFKDGTERYKCACNVWIDRCIGRLDTSSCRLPRVPRRGHDWMPECDCSAASSRGSARLVGMMPVYYPFPKFGPNRTKTTQCAPEIVPPAASSVYLGEWYSMPEEAECPPDTVHFGEQQEEQEEGVASSSPSCTWARRATHHLVHGRQLLDAGFNLSHGYDIAQLRQNEGIVEKVLARHPVRCCDC